jgi:hypothetical protein
VEARSRTIPAASISIAPAIMPVGSSIREP